MREITIADFLTDDEIAKAQSLYQQFKDTGQFAQRVADELIRPNMARINRALGQQNDARYLAYVVEYVLSRGTR